jgi:phosphonate transport system permease protein
MTFTPPDPALSAPSSPLSAVTPARVCVGLLLLAIFLLPFADLSIVGRSPWPIAVSILSGFLHPDFTTVESLGYASVLTISFGFCGLAAGVAAGLAMALLYGFRSVRLLAAILRSVHELIWALLLLAIFGPTVWTGVSAIALAYAGIFAKVYSEILDEADQRVAQVLPMTTDRMSRFVYGRAAVAYPALASYTRYRLECAIRSSAVLGFIGLPTLGFQLDSFFKQGHYDSVAAVLLVYFALIGSLNLWLRRPLVPVYLLASVGVLIWHPGPEIAGSNLWVFLTHDIVPVPLRDASLLDGETWTRFWLWLRGLLTTQIWPGLVNTLIVGQITLALTGLLAVVLYPIAVTRFVGTAGAAAGYGALVVGRSTPEYMLGYLFLQMFGPSMLPAILALSLHNGAIIAHLLGRQADDVARTLRIDAPRGLNLYLYELQPRLFGPFLALCLYRWEIILRESAILGILGVKTLGFHIDSAVAELRLDRVMVLIAATAILTIAVDAASRTLRARLKAETVPTRCDG